MRVPSLATALCALYLLSCSSTIPSRIQEKHQAFDSYPKDIQAKIKRGSIQPGFTEEMVYMAKGRPSRVIARQELSHSYVLWLYDREEELPRPKKKHKDDSNPHGISPLDAGIPPPKSVTTRDYVYLLVKFETSRVVDWKNQIPP